METNQKKTTIDAVNHTPPRIQRIWGIWDNPQLIKDNCKSMEVYSFQMLEPISAHAFEEAFNVMILNTHARITGTARVTGITLNWSNFDNTYIIGVLSPDCINSFLRCNSEPVEKDGTPTAERVFRKYKEIIFTILQGKA